jgi:hypothetical protein
MSLVLVLVERVIEELCMRHDRLSTTVGSSAKRRYEDSLVGRCFILSRMSTDVCRHWCGEGKESEGARLSLTFV